MTNVGPPLLLCAAIGAAPSAAASDGKAADAEAKMFTMGSGYEDFMGRWSRLLAVRLVDFSGVRDGDRVLDVGTGTGALAAAVHEAAPASEIVAIDPSAGFIGFAKKRLTSEHVKFEVGDAQSMRFGDGSFDRTMALLAMNFIPDHRRAMNEMRRVTKPQGVISTCVWDYNEGMQSLRYFWDEAVAQEPSVAAKDERNMKLSRSGQLAELWKSAGLVNVVEKPLVIDQTYRSFDDYWKPFLTGVGPGGAYVVSLPADRRQQLEARLRARLLGDRADGPFTLKARAWCVRGQVPGA